MGDVEAFSIAGLKCYFGSNDHYPQHFHILKRGQWVIRVFFLRTSRKRGLNWEYKYSWQGSEVLPVEEQEILRLVLAHKRRLLAEWNRKVSAARERKETKHEHKTTLPGPQHG